MTHVPALACVFVAVLSAESAFAQVPSAPVASVPAPPASVAAPAPAPATVAPASVPTPTTSDVMGAPQNVPPPPPAFGGYAPQAPPVGYAPTPYPPPGWQPQPLEVPPPVDRRTPLAPSHPPDRDWHAAGYLGGFGVAGESASSSRGGATFGATFQYRSGFFQGGALAEYGGAPLGFSYTGIALVAGLATRPATNVRLSVLGILGGHFYSNVDRNILSNSPAAKGSTGYAGVRGTLSYIFGRGIGHFELGAYGELADDLSRQRFIDSFGDSNVIGITRVGFGIEVGGTHDIF